jgi:hypothetical protein
VIYTAQRLYQVSLASFQRFYRYIDKCNLSYMCSAHIDTVTSNLVISTGSLALFFWYLRLDGHVTDVETRNVCRVVMRFGEFGKYKMDLGCI